MHIKNLEYNVKYDLDNCKWKYDICADFKKNLRGDNFVKVKGKQ